MLPCRLDITDVALRNIRTGRALRTQHCEIGWFYGHVAAGQHWFM